MLTYILQRLGFQLLVVFGMILAVFLLTNFIPADPARVAVGPDASQEQVEIMRHKLGLDKPIIEQFGLYLSRLVQGDLGISLWDHEPVLDALIRYAPASIELAVVAMFLSVTSGLFIGVYSATHHGSLGDGVVRLIAIAGRAAPSFWIALLLQLIFYGNLGWFPSGERIDRMVTTEPTHITGMYLVDSALTANWSALVDSAYHIIMPALALALGGIAEVSRLMAAAVQIELRRDYTRTAHAKGLAGRVVLSRHVMRNAINPVVTVAGIRFGYLLAGTVLIESIFRWPGIGRYALIAIQNIDFPVIMGITLFVSIAFALVNLSVDLLYGFLDPRIRHA